MIQQTRKANRFQACVRNLPRSSRLGFGYMCRQPRFHSTSTSSTENYCRTGHQCPMYTPCLSKRMPLSSTKTTTDQHQKPAGKKMTDRRIGLQNTWFQKNLQGPNVGPCLTHNGCREGVLHNIRGKQRSPCAESSLMQRGTDPWRALRIMSTNTG